MRFILCRSCGQRQTTQPSGICWECLQKGVAARTARQTNDEYKAAPPAGRRQRCGECGKLVDRVIEPEDKRELARCPACLDAFTHRREYVDKYYKVRNKALITLAKNNKKQARHCPECRHLRVRSEFIKPNDPYGVCSLCRQQTEDALKKAEAQARWDAKNTQWAKETMKRSNFK